MLKQTTWLTLGFALMAAVACSSSSSSSTPGGGGDGSGAGGDSSANNATGSVKDYCTESCTKSHGCDKTVDVQTCSNSCKNDFAAVGPKLRDDFLGSITACFGDQDCVAVLDDEALGKCTDEAVAELAPSKEGTTFCTNYEDAVDKCNGDFDKADCYDQAKTFNDDALKEAEDCLDKACADIDDCVKATLGAIKDIGGGNTDPGNGTGGTDSGTAGSSGSGTAGTPAAGGTSGTDPITGTCTTTSPEQCASATSINTCVNGKYAVVTCKTYYGEIGFASSKCADDACDVASALDAKCATGIANYCGCLSTPCTANEKLDAYISCFQDDPTGYQAAVQCMAPATTCTQVQACIPE